jgi:hypothetical protein
LYGCAGIPRCGERLLFDDVKGLQIMGNFGLIHLLIVAVILLVYVAVPVIVYKVGKKVGDQGGYIRGYKEGQQSLQGMK